MKWTRIACTLLMMGVSLSAFAQTPVHPTPPVQAAKPKVEPCWQVAGISKATIDQRNAIARATREQVEQVCANNSLSPQQKQQEIKQIHQQEKQQMEGLITPEQQSAMRTCQQERNPNPGPHVAHGGGPCGEMPPTNPATGAGEQPQSEDTPKPN